MQCDMCWHARGSEVTDIYVDVQLQIREKGEEGYLQHVLETWAEVRHGYVQKLQRDMMGRRAVYY